MNGLYQPYWSDGTSAELEHHGILGMKWGIRRYQNKDGTLTAAGKKRYYKEGTHGEVLGQSRDRDIRIAKGTQAYRLQEGNKLKPGQTYVSFDQLDHYNYIAIASSGEDPWFRNTMRDPETGKPRDKNAYSVTLKLTNDMIAPSYEQTMDVFIKTMGQVKMSDIFEDPSNKWEANRQKKFLENVKKFTIEECRDKAYADFAGTFTKDTKARKIFFDSLKEMGYNAIIDENDARFGKDSFTKSPVILFDSSDLKVTKTKPLSANDVEEFANLWFAGVDPLSMPSDFKKRWKNIEKANI